MAYTLACRCLSPEQLGRRQAAFQLQCFAVATFSNYYHYYETNVNVLFGED